MFLEAGCVAVGIQRRRSAFFSTCPKSRGFWESRDDMNQLEHKQERKGNSQLVRDS